MAEKPSLLRLSVLFSKYEVWIVQETDNSDNLRMQFSLHSLAKTSIRNRHPGGAHLRQTLRTISSALLPTWVQPLPWPIDFMIAFVCSWDASKALHCLLYTISQSSVCCRQACQMQTLVPSSLAAKQTAPARAQVWFPSLSHLSGHKKIC